MARTVLLVLFLLFLLSFSPAVAAPAARPKPVATPTPAVPSGYGVVVCDPVSKTASADLHNFGAGCTRWLQLILGGHGELGKTPAWSSIAHCAIELKQNDLRLTPTQAKSLKRMLGITHAVLANIEGTADSCRLQLSLLELPALNAAGGVITVTGSRDQVIGGLPATATSLLKELGVTFPRVPAPGMTPDEMQLCGSMPWDCFVQHRELTADRVATLKTAANHDALPALLLLPAANQEYQELGHELRYEATQQLLKHALNNPIALLACANYSLPDLAIRGDAISRNLGIYPHSYALNAASAEWLNQRGERDAQRRVAWHAVQCTPGNPDAWLLFANAIYQASDDIRHARYFNDLSDDDARKVGAYYEQWYEAIKKATMLDPTNDRALLALATAGSFAGYDENETASAFWRALKVDPDNLAIYRWGLQMFQPKWQGPEGKENLLKVVELAIADPQRSVDLFQAIGDALYYSNYRDARTGVLNQIYTARTDDSFRNANDPQALWLAGRIYLKWNQLPQALDAFNRYAALQPPSVATQLHIATTYAEENRYQEAVPHITTAITLDPRAASLYFLRGLFLFRQNNYSVIDLENATRLQADYPVAWSLLGDVYYHLQRQADAEQAYATALELRPGDTETIYSLGWSCLYTSQWHSALKAFTDLLKVNPSHYGALKYAPLAAYCAHRYEQVITFARQYIDHYRWRNESLYQALVAYFAYAQLDQIDTGKKLLKSAKLTVDAAAWPFPIVRYLLREIDEEQALKQADNAARLAEAKGFIGLSKWLSGHRGADTAEALRAAQKDTGLLSYVDLLSRPAIGRVN